MKSTIKRIFLFFLCVTLAFAATACGSVVQGDGSGSIGGNSGGNASGGIGDNTGDNYGDDLAFTVTVVPEVSVSAAYLTTIKVIWTDLASNNGASYTAYCNSDGKAKISDLDGDYIVTLTGLPDGFTYNPNDESHIATNDERDVSIDLYKLTSLPDGKKGTNFYGDVCELPDIGAYRAVLTEENFDDGIRFRYEPKYQGKYSVESIIDVTANVINPLLDMHNGTAQWVNEQTWETYDGGGAESTYTRNFKWEFQIVDIGNSFAFRIYADVLDKNVFPVNIDFILDRDGEYAGDTDDTDTVIVNPTENFEANADKAFEGTSGKTFKYFAHYEQEKYQRNDGVLSGSYVKLDETDGYYYIVDGEYKNRLYAKITQDSEIIVTDGGDTAGGFNYPLIRLNKLKIYNEDLGKDVYYNYQSFIRTAYAAHTNRDGVYPVTEELKLFLQRYSVSQRLFNDGNGIAEKINVNGVDMTFYQSSASNQWLFNCGYYE